MNKLTSIFLISLAFCVNSYSQGNLPEMKDIAGFKERLSRTGSSTKTIESDFVQEKHLEMMSEKIVSKGKFYFKKEGRMRWEYTNPINYIIAMNGNDIFIKNEKKINKFDLNSNQAFKEISNIMLAASSGNILDSKEFQPQFFDSKDFYVVKLQPVNPKMKDFLSQLNIYFNKADLSVAKTELIEQNGDKTIVEFKNKKINKPIPDEIFKLN